MHLITDILTIQAAGNAREQVRMALYETEHGRWVELRSYRLRETTWVRTSNVVRISRTDVWPLIESLMFADAEFWPC